MPRSPQAPAVVPRRPASRAGEIADGHGEQDRAAAHNGRHGAAHGGTSVSCRGERTAPGSRVTPGSGTERPLSPPPSRGRPGPGSRPTRGRPASGSNAPARPSRFGRSRWSTGQRPPQVGGDPPVPGPAGAGQQRRPDHRGGVGPARGEYGGQQHVGDPAGAAAGPPRPQGQRGVAVVAHGAGAGVTPGVQRAGAFRAGERAGGQVGLGLAGGRRSRIAARWGHGARAVPSTTGGGGQLVWQPIRPVGRTGGPGRHRSGSAR